MYVFFFAHIDFLFNFAEALILLSTIVVIYNHTTEKNIKALFNLCNHKSLFIII